MLYITCNKYNEDRPGCHYINFYRFCIGILTAYMNMVDKRYASSEHIPPNAVTNGNVTPIRLTFDDYYVFIVTLNVHYFNFILREFTSGNWCLRLQ